MSLPTQMKFADHGAGGRPEVIHMSQGPVPTPAAGEVLVQVAYAGVNRPDCIQRSGRYPPPPGASPIMGLEISGEVVALGAGVTRLKPLASSWKWMRLFTITSRPAMPKSSNVGSHAPGSTRVRSSSISNFRSTPATPPTTVTSSVSQNFSRATSQSSASTQSLPATLLATRSVTLFTGKSLARGANSTTHVGRSRMISWPMILNV